MKKKEQKQPEKPKHSHCHTPAERAERKRQRDAASLAGQTQPRATFVSPYPVPTPKPVVMEHAHDKNLTLSSVLKNMPEYQRWVYERNQRLSFVAYALAKHDPSWSATIRTRQGVFSNGAKIGFSRFNEKELEHIASVAQ